MPQRGLISAELPVDLSTPQGAKGLPASLASRAALFGGCRPSREGLMLAGGVRGLSCEGVIDCR